MAIERVSDERLRWLSGPDYIRSEPGQIAAELLVARAALREIKDCDYVSRHCKSCHDIAEDALAASETACELCEGSGESGVNHHDGTQYSTKTPPCPDCGGSGKKATKGDASG